jgi:HD-GYP domain-containing protein (c-di-GMP phosphodiesterase class II)
MKWPLLVPAGVVAILAATLALLRPAVLGDVDRRVYDALSRTSPAAENPPPLLVVAVDEASLGALGQWPWSRDLIARLVQRLQEAGVASIAFDVLFAEAERAAPAGKTSMDGALAEALARAPAVASYAFVFGANESDPPCTLHPASVVQRQQGERLPSAALVRASGVVCTLGTLTEAAGASGHLNAFTDSDGLLRRVPLLIAYRDKIYPSLALSAVQRMTNQTPLLLERRGDEQLVLTVNGRRIGLDEQGRLLLRYGPRRTTTVSAADVIEGRVRGDALRGRVVFVGATAVGLDDVVATPLHRELPGVEVHATVAEGLLSSLVNHRPEYATLVELVVTVLCGLVVVILGHRLGLRASAAGAAILLLGIWWSARALLHRDGTYLTPLYPALAVVLGMAAAALAGVARERRRAERERGRRGDAQRLIVQALTTLTETRDVDTGRHARRTQEYTRLLATALGRRPAHRGTLTEDLISLVSTLAPLHDIGKVGVSDAVLRKPGALTTTELAEMRRHPGLGHESLLKAEALAGVHDDEVLKVAKEIVHTHHEFWDGSGYPSGLRGADIPLSGRIVALVDSYDAMVAERTYRKAMSHKEAVDAIVSARGQHFDPEIVDAFLTVEAEFARIAAQYATSD